MSQKEKDAIRSQLPEDLQPVFDRLVEEYRFHALRIHGHPFVSYKVLAALVEDGWQPPEEQKCKRKPQEK